MNNIKSNEEWIRTAIDLAKSISQDERVQIIESGRNNEYMVAISVAAHTALEDGDINAFRTMIDTAFCLGVQYGRRII